jgi:hypothetical protein
MKAFIVILSLALLAIGVIFFMKGCPKDIDPRDRAIDSLKFAQKTDSIQYQARASLADNTIRGLIGQLRDTTAALQASRKQFTIQGKQILAANKDLHAALIVHDTPEVYKNAQYISFQIDSISTVAWNMGRELDKQIVLNEQLQTADSAALADCRGTLKNTQVGYSTLAANYEVQHQQDQKALKKAKKGKWLFGLGGTAVGAFIRSIF